MKLLKFIILLWSSHLRLDAVVRTTTPPVIKSASRLEHSSEQGSGTWVSTQAWAENHKTVDDIIDIAGSGNLWQHQRASVGLSTSQAPVW